MNGLFEHYYGDNIRILFLGAVFIMLISLPFVQQRLPISLIIVVLVIMVLGVLLESPLLCGNGFPILMRVSLLLGFCSLVILLCIYINSMVHLIIFSGSMVFWRLFSFCSLLCHKDALG